MLSAATAGICAVIFFYLLLCNVLLFRCYGLTGADLTFDGYSGSIIFIALSVLLLSRLSVILFLLHCCVQNYVSPSLMVCV